MATVMNPMNETSEQKAQEDFGAKLREQTQAVRLHFEKLGLSKSLSSEQRDQAAEPFGAEGKSLSASKKKLSGKNKYVRALTRIRNGAMNYYKAVSVDFPEMGVRLIRKDRIEKFEQQMSAFKAEMKSAAAELDEHREELIDEARERLGELFDPSDYPQSLGAQYTMHWDFPNIEPPQTLAKLHPELYEREQQRVAQKFDEAVQIAEEAFSEQLHKMVSHLIDRLTPQEDGSQKLLMSSAVENFHDFFTSFKTLNIHSNAELDELVETAEQLMDGVDPKALRKDVHQKQELKEKLDQVKSNLDQFLEDRPKRKIKFND